MLGAIGAHMCKFEQFMANVSVSLLTLTIKAVLYWAGDVKQTLYVSSRAPGAPFYIERDSYIQAGRPAFQFYSLRACFVGLHTTLLHRKRRVGMYSLL